VALAPNGRLFLVWESNGSPAGGDNSGFSVHGRFFFEGLFADGFETGNTSRWSVSP
jgi:hypothetical protein